MQEIIAGVEADTTQLKFELSSVKAILRSKGNLHRLWLCFWTALILTATYLKIGEKFFINPIGIQILSWRYYIFQCVFNALLTTIIYFTYAETSGLTIEEIAGIFCGEEQFQNALARPELEKMGVER
ncbi:hypothetical protein Sste5346_002179 [Sporothrix stenoceras]|uniref:Uncharacterized protein n=1 Tax=Sporothrix stenoceras TaxID=5173 RepID=A0ABR3ZLS4_9PEZI